jgi:hypothetical protein
MRLSLMGSVKPELACPAMQNVNLNALSGTAIPQPSFRRSFSAMPVNATGGRKAAAPLDTYMTSTLAAQVQAELVQLGQHAVEVPLEDVDDGVHDPDWFPDVKEKEDEEDEEDEEEDDNSDISPEEVIQLLADLEAPSLRAAAGDSSYVVYDEAVLLQNLADFYVANVRFTEVEAAFLKNLTFESAGVDISNFQALRRRSISASRAGSILSNSRGPNADLQKADRLFLNPPDLSNLAAIRYGKDNEAAALEMLCEHWKKECTKVLAVNSLILADFIIQPGVTCLCEFVNFTAAPDARIVNDGHLPLQYVGNGVAEVKAGESLAGIPIDCTDLTPFLDLAGFAAMVWCIEARAFTAIKKTHHHYAQIQMQMAVEQAQWGWYGVWAPAPVARVILFIPFDPGFWHGILLPKVSHFFWNSLLPALYYETVPSAKGWVVHNKFGDTTVAGTLTITEESLLARITAPTMAQAHEAGVMRLTTIFQLLAVLDVKCDHFLSRLYNDDVGRVLFIAPRYTLVRWTGVILQAMRQLESPIAFMRHALIACTSQWSDWLDRDAVTQFGTLTQYVATSISTIAEHLPQEFRLQCGAMLSVLAALTPRNLDVLIRTSSVSEVAIPDNSTPFALHIPSDGCSTFLLAAAVSFDTFESLVDLRLRCPVSHGAPRHEYAPLAILLCDSATAQCTVYALNDILSHWVQFTHVNKTVPIHAGELDIEQSSVVMLLQLVKLPVRLPCDIGVVAAGVVPSSSVAAVESFPAFGRSNSSIQDLVWEVRSTLTNYSVHFSQDTGGCAITAALTILVHTQLPTLYNLQSEALPTRVVDNLLTALARLVVHRQEPTALWGVDWTAAVSLQQYIRTELRSSLLPLDCPNVALSVLLDTPKLSTPVSFIGQAQYACDCHHTWASATPEPPQTTMIVPVSGCAQHGLQRHCLFAMLCAAMRAVSSTLVGEQKLVDFFQQYSLSEVPFTCETAVDWLKQKWYDFTLSPLLDICGISPDKFKFCPFDLTMQLDYHNHCRPELKTLSIVCPNSDCRYHNGDGGICNAQRTRRLQHPGELVWIQVVFATDESEELCAAQAGLTIIDRTLPESQHKCKLILPLNLSFSLGWEEDSRTVEFCLVGGIKHMPWHFAPFIVFDSTVALLYDDLLDSLPVAFDLGQAVSVSTLMYRVTTAVPVVTTIQRVPSPYPLLAAFGGTAAYSVPSRAFAHRVSMMRASGVVLNTENCIDMMRLNVGAFQHWFVTDVFTIENCLFLVNECAIFRRVAGTAHLDVTFKSKFEQYEQGILAAETCVTDRLSDGLQQYFGES